MSPPRVGKSTTMEIPNFDMGVPDFLVEMFYMDGDDILGTIDINQLIAASSNAYWTEMDRELGQPVMDFPPPETPSVPSSAGGNNPSPHRIKSESTQSAGQRFKRGSDKELEEYYSSHQSNSTNNNKKSEASKYCKVGLCLF